MILWSQWYGCVQNFQAACSRSRTYLYLVLVLVGFFHSSCAPTTRLPKIPDTISHLLYCMMAAIEWILTGGKGKVFFCP